MTTPSLSAIVRALDPQAIPAGKSAMHAAMAEAAVAAQARSIAELLDALGISPETALRAVQERAHARESVPA